MCYSAEVWTDYKKFQKHFPKIDVDIHEFFRLFYDREHDPKARIKTPKGMDDAFAHSHGPEFADIRSEISAWNSAQASKFEKELFTQKQRLNAAERSIAEGKTTKKALEDQRIATDKIGKARTKLDDLRRTESKPRDNRIFPGTYAPVLIMENGRHVLRPMRYQCRPAGKPAFYDTKFPGTYNARRDNLTGFWKDLFGHTHGILPVTTFYENVSRHAAEHRELAPGEKEENVVLAFTPNPPDTMFVACLVSYWQDPKGKEPPLWSFAAITDEPPAEVAAAGHDRCIIQIAPEKIDAWLTPKGRTPNELQSILDERPRPFYEHRMAA